LDDILNINNIQIYNSKLKRNKYTTANF